MTGTVFGELYADCYDILYHDKDYEAECDLLEEVFRRYSAGPVQTILDLGCGTGNHAFPLARRAYQVTGVDLSPEMLDRAGDKAASLPLPPGCPPPTFHLGDVRRLELGCQFDAVLMMFAVLCYQPTDAEVLAALSTVRRHLKPGGVFGADVWYGPAVLNLGLESREKEVNTPHGKVVRTVSPSLDPVRHLAQVRCLVTWERDGQLVKESAETHVMRYFFPLELVRLLDQSGLKLLHLGNFDNIGSAPDDTTWKALLIGGCQ